MKSFLFCVLFCASLSFGLRAADTSASFSAEKKDDIVRAVTAADDERVAAMIAADQKRLEAIFSDDLRYGHSNGRLDNKASYISQFVTRRSLYESYRYKERVFSALAPEVVAMTGRVLIHVHRNDGSVEDLDLNFLSLWRLESGQWRFYASQSSRIPAPATPSK